MMDWTGKAGSVSAQSLGRHPMMIWQGQNPWPFQVVAVMHLLTWVLVVAALVAFTRWMWKKGDKVK